MQCVWAKLTCPVIGALGATLVSRIGKVKGIEKANYITCNHWQTVRLELNGGMVEDIPIESTWSG